MPSELYSDAVASFRWAAVHKALGWKPEQKVSLGHSIVDRVRFDGSTQGRPVNHVGPDRGNALPKTETGKIQRFALRARA